MPGGVVDVVKQALDHRADVAPAEYSQVGIGKVLVFERGNGCRSVFPIAVEIRVCRIAWSS